MTPVGAFAASKKTSKRPYKDVTKKSCGEEYRDAINEYARHGDLKKVVKGEKFHPFKPATRGFEVASLRNRLRKKYGHKNVIPPKYLKMSKKNKEEKVTREWKEEFLTDVAAYGYGITIYYPEESPKRLKQVVDRGCSICFDVRWEKIVRPGKCKPLH